MPVSFERFNPNPTEALPLLTEVPKECSICTDLLSDRPSTAHKTGKTWHAFHTDCLNTWLKEKHTCPLCREKVDSVNGKAPPESPEVQFARRKRNINIASIIGIVLGLLGAILLNPLFGVLIAAAVAVFALNEKRSPSITT